MVFEQRSFLVGIIFHLCIRKQTATRSLRKILPAEPSDQRVPLVCYLTAIEDIGWFGIVTQLSQQSVTQLS